MDDSLYESIFKFKENGTLIEGSRFAKYRFKKHYESPEWNVKNKLLYFNDKLVIPEREANNILKKFFDNPKTTSNGKLKFYSIVSANTYGITFKQVSEFLDNQEAYQLHKPAPKLRVVKPIIKDKPGVYYQVDLILLPALKNSNNNFENILTVIDVFSKKAWAFPLKTKEAREVSLNFAKVIEESPNLKIVQTDQGSEFQAEFDELLNRNGIRHQLSKSYTPQSQGQIEKFNGTLKAAIYQHFTKYNTKVYVDVLPSFVENYNSRIHGTTKEEPNKIFAGNSDNKLIKERITEASVGASKFNSKLNKSNSVKAGDFVRILKSSLDAKTRKNIFKKSYEKKWSAKMYRVLKVQNLKGYKLIQVEGLTEKFHIDDIQVVDFDKTVPANGKREDLQNYGIELLKTREDNIKKAQAAKNGLESKVEVSNYNLRKRKPVNYKV